MIKLDAAKSVLGNCTSLEHQRCYVTERAGLALVLHLKSICKQWVSTSLNYLIDFVSISVLLWVLFIDSFSVLHRKAKHNWLSAIRRANYELTKYSVGVKRFYKRFIILKNSIQVA